VIGPPRAECCFGELGNRTREHAPSLESRSRGWVPSHLSITRVRAAREEMRGSLAVRDNAWKFWRRFVVRRWASCGRRDSRPIARRYLVLVRVEGSENLILFLLGNVEMVQASFKLGRYLVELIRCNRELSMSFL
jgi:hypothetical protein